MATNEDSSAACLMGNLVDSGAAEGIFNAMRGFGAHDNAEDCDIFLPSTSDARIALTNDLLLRRISGDRLHMKSVAEWIVSHKDEVSGDAGDWHMLVNPFFEISDYKTALDITQAGRERFCYDATLLGDEIRCAGNLGDWKLGDQLVGQASNGDYRSDEDWSFALYVSDYLMARAHAEDETTRQSTYEEALAFLREAKARLPKNDRILNAEAGVLIEANRIEDARDLLEDVIFMRDYNDSIPNPQRYPVAQCCLTYLGKILSNSCDYDKIIEVADAGIRFAATEQESVNLGYFFYRKALAMDGQINANGGGGKSQGFGNQDYVRNAMKTYALAYALNETETYRTYRIICEKRFLALGVMGGIDDMAIDEYCSKNASDDD